MRIFLPVLLIVILFSITGCDDTRIYETNKDFKGNDWFIDSVAFFSFEIKDATSDYNILTNVRNAISYPFANLYIKYTLLDSNNKTIDGKLLRLPLFDKKTGKPYGDGLGDIFDHQFTLLKGHKFQEPGVYKVRIKQYMRQDPLPFIMSVGVRVEKAEGENQE